MDHVGSNTKSRGQMLEKPCVRSKGHIFSQMIMKLGQNFCLDELSHEYKMVHVWSKTRSNHRKTLCALETRFSF